MDFLIKNSNLINAYCMSSIESIRLMVENEFFTIELLIEYLLRYRNDQSVVKILIAKLKTYPKSSIKRHLNELVFYALHANCVELDPFFLHLCADDFNFFFLITNAFEIWGNQFINQSPALKKRIRTILEDCETAMVNGEKSNLIMKSATEIPGEKPEIDQEALYNFVIGKRTKNDFKDDVRFFVSYLVKLSYLLLGEDRTKIRKIAVDFLHKLNLELHSRRSKSADCMFSK